MAPLSITNFELQFQNFFHYCVFELLFKVVSYVKALIWDDVILLKFPFEVGILHMC